MLILTPLPGVSAIALPGKDIKNMNVQEEPLHYPLAVASVSFCKLIQNTGFSKYGFAFKYGMWEIPETQDLAATSTGYTCLFKAKLFLKSHCINNLFQNFWF